MAKTPRLLEGAAASMLYDKLRLRHSKRINPDDFERVWSPVQKPVFSMVPLN